MSDQLRLEDEELPITLRRAWDRALRLLLQRVSTPTFTSHIRRMRLIELDLDTAPVRVVLGAPADFTRDWVERRHGDMVAEVFSDVVSAPVTVSYALCKDEPEEAAAPVEPAVAKPRPRRTAPSAPEAVAPSGNFPARYSFEQFVVSADNR
ncbi:MAG: DnaA N-terminal domain-containing protein, partial [Armatimonadota bacterium]